MVSVEIDHGKNQYLFTTYVSEELVTHLQDDYNFERAVRAISHKDQLKIRNIKLPEIRYKQLVTKLFQLYVINLVRYHRRGECIFKPWEPVELVYNEYGKPELRDGDMAISSSSSNRLIAIVVQIHPSSIGIDLSHSQQRLLPETFMDDFAGVFYESELQQLQEISNLDSRYYIFNQFWTLKEAFTKLLGTGLNIDLSKFYFNLNHQYIDPHKGSIDLESKSICQEYGPSWRLGIQLDAQQLDITSTEFQCKSATLLPTSFEGLPVIVSIIAETDFESVSYHINFQSLLESMD